MRSSDQGTGPPKELAQLLRLRQVRVDAAEAAVRLQRAECEQAAAAVQARLHQIEANRCNVNNHATYAVGQGANDLARMPTLFSAYRAQLDDTLERSEYALIDDEQALEASEARLRDKRQAWMREQSRRDGVGETLQRSRRAVSRRTDLQAENDADELRRIGLLSPLSSERP